jgi:ubiquinone/menaquinone biosynthesis C-methylase UbiE
MAWFSGVPIYVDTRHTCNHQHYHPNDRFAYRVPLAHQANNGHWIHAAFFPKTYESYWLPTLKKRFRDRSDYWSCLDKRGWPSKLEGRRTIEGFRKEIADRAVRTEEDFYELILGEPMPRPEISAITDEAYIRQQRRRSKPGGDYSSVERRQARALDWFISQVPGCIKGLKVLDLGARDGYLVERLQNLGVYKAEGVELVPDTAEYARTVLKRNVITGDMRRLPYKDGQWHRVLCLHTLEHVPDPKAAITEMLRVLMPGGWFLIVVPIDKEGPERRFSHNSYFPDEKALIDIVTNGHPVQGIKTEVKALKPKKQEILLVGQKERPTTASQTRRKR